MKKYVGKHCIFDLYLTPNCDSLFKPSEFMKAMEESCLEVGASVMSRECHQFGEQYGYTFTLILAESHASCHTWPEYGLATFDIFMCGDCDPFKAREIFMKKLKDRILKSVETNIMRGEYDEVSDGNV